MTHLQGGVYVEGFASVAFEPRELRSMEWVRDDKAWLGRNGQAAL